MARQSNEERNAKRRARDAALKELGLTRSQRRNLGKAIEAEPGILEKIGGAFLGLGKKVTEGLQNVGSDVLGTGDLGKGSSPSGMGGKGAAKSGGSSGGGGGKRGGGKGSVGGGKKPPDFESFARRGLAEGKTGKQIEREYRAAGGSISHANSQKVIRGIKGQEEKEAKKITKFRDETGKGTIKGGVRYYKSSDLRVERKNRAGEIKRTKFTYMKAKYGYVVKYKVMVNGKEEERYATVASDTELSPEQVVREFEDMYGQAEADDGERYNSNILVDGSVVIDYVMIKDS